MEILSKTVIIAVRIRGGNGFSKLVTRTRSLKRLYEVVPVFN
jgi:hypothetical protein